MGFFPCPRACKTSHPVSPTLSQEGEILQSNLKDFSYNEVKNATENFDPGNELGRGGFGTVYKGWIDEQSFAPAEPGAGMVIAAKKLNEGGAQGHKEWLTEIKFLGRLSHPNLVKLIGYCLEDNNRLLVYEFMPMGSLDNHLFIGASNVQLLSWACRMRIALGAAKGIAFLHRKKVIYRDIKTANILLDANYNVKLSDFGLAKDGPTGNKSHVTTGVMGTWGYADPAYLVSGHLTLESDVYSFGVVLLEILSGKRVLDNDRTRPTGEYNLVHWAKPHLKKREVHRVFDSRIEVQYSLSAARKAARLVTLCLDENPKLRPKMVKVVVMLEQLQQTGILPKETQKNGPQS